MPRLLAFDISISSTGWVLLDQGSSELPEVVDSGLIATEAVGGWYSPHRYLYYMKLFDELLERIGEEGMDFAAEDIVWGGNSAPGLFALHPRVWEWAYKLNSQFVYLNRSQWYWLLVDQFGIEKEVVDIEGKALAMKLCHANTKIKRLKNDIADAWGVGIAAWAFYRYLDGELEELSAKQRQIFDRRATRKGPQGHRREVHEGLVHQKDKHYFDWRQQ